MADCNSLISAFESRFSAIKVPKPASPPPLNGPVI
jgi:hypothetical protein